MQEPNPQPGRSVYLDFELEIGLGSGRDYPVTVLRSPAGEAHTTMHFPFDDLALELRLGKLQIALLRSSGKHRRVPSEEEQAVQDLGQSLFDALFSGRVRTCYDVSLREAAQQDKGVRLKLRIRPPELSALPWEFLYDPDRDEYVCLSRRTPIVRYLESPRLIRPLTVTPPLRILGMIASPQDLPVLDMEREKQIVEQATQGLRDRGLLELEWLPGQTSRDLQEAMWGGPWHVFHFIGHGGFDALTDEGFIVLADSAGHMNRLNATRLGRQLADHTTLRLVLLNACEGAKGSEQDVYSSTASILVHQGVLAVVAMQYEITDRAAIDFARTFYRALAYGMAVDEAVVAARKAIDLAVTSTVEWGTPVLYMRTPDGVLFDVAGAAMPPSSNLYEEALAALAVEDRATAVEKLQAVLVQNPYHRDAAARLKQMQQEQDLSAVLGTASGPTALRPATSAERAPTEPRRRIQGVPFWAWIAIAFFGLLLLVGSSLGIWSALQPGLVMSTPSPAATQAPTGEPTSVVLATSTSSPTPAPTPEGSGTPPTTLSVEPKPTSGTSSSLTKIPEPIIPYDPRFLGAGHIVPLPRLTGATLDSAWNDGEVVDYLHYSLVMNQERGLAIYTAANLDRENAGSVTRKMDYWITDERLPRAIQREHPLYLDNDWDRGHLVSRLDITWGELTSTNPSSLQQAVNFFPNTSPQHKDFNRGLWLELETWIRDSLEPSAPRVVIFTGPVFRESDLEYRLTIIPQTYWKLAVLVNPENPNFVRVYAFAIDQYTHDPLSEVPVTEVYPGLTPSNFDATRFQVSVRQIEEWTGLDFEYLEQFDVAREE